MALSERKEATGLGVILRAGALCVWLFIDPGCRLSVLMFLVMRSDPVRLFSLISFPLHVFLLSFLSICTEW